MTSFDGLNGFNKIFNFTTLTAVMNAWAITKSSVFWQRRVRECLCLWCQVIQEPILGQKTWELTVLRTMLTPALLNWVLSYTWGLRRSGDQEIRLTRLMLIGLKMPFIFYVFDDLASSLIFKLRFWRFDIILLYNICVSLRCGGFSIIILTVWVKWQKIL